MPKPTPFGLRLRELRDSREWTQDDLARKTGLAASVISHFETGVRGKPSADNLVKLAKAFGVSVDYLLGRTDLPDVSDERVAALLRSLSGTSAETYENFLALGELLVDRDKEKKKHEAPREERSEEGS